MIPSALRTIALLDRLCAQYHKYTEEQWGTEQQITVRALREKPVDQKLAHADAANRHEQTIAGLKDIALWLW